MYELNLSPEIETRYRLRIVSMARPTPSTFHLYSPTPRLKH